MSITIIGGTGPQGKGLAKRFALSGYKVILGSRNRERAEEVSSELNSSLPENFRNISDLRILYLRSLLDLVLYRKKSVYN